MQVPQGVLPQTSVEPPYELRVAAFTASLRELKSLLSQATLFGFRPFQFLEALGGPCHEQHDQDDHRSDEK